MKLYLKNLLFALTLFFTGTVFGQSCETTSIETGLYSPSKIMTCDFNGDGANDIVFLDSLSRNVFWKRNLGSDNFAAATPLVGGVEVTFLKSCNLDNNDSEEIIFTTGQRVYYILYTGPATIDFSVLFTVPSFYVIDAIAIGDFNNDGSDGMVFTYSREATLNVRVDVIKNLGGTLSLDNIYNETVGFLTDIAVGDIANNGRMDIAISGYSNLWFKNISAGTFGESRTISSANSDFGRSALFDYDNDGDTELIILDNDGDLKTYDIDPNGEGWLYTPETILTGLPGDPQTWEHVSLNGRDVLLLSSADEIIGLDNVGNSFTRVSYCDDISDLNGVAVVARQDGYKQFVFSREAAKTLEKIEETQTNSIPEIVSNQLEIYPNPTSQLVNVKTKNGSAIKNIIAVNAMGQTVEIKKIEEGKYGIDHLPNGLYHLVITDSEGNIFTESVVKND